MITRAPDDPVVARLHAAAELLDDPSRLPGTWARACVWLIRLAAEHTLDEYWARRGHRSVDWSRRCGLLALAMAEGDVGYRLNALWEALSRVAHHHAYELSPTVDELREWLAEAWALRTLVSGE